MDGLALFLKIALLLYALYSMGAYFLRRSDNRSGLDALEKSPVLRQISPQELAALQPFLIGRKLEAQPGVRALGGEFLRHGLQVQGSTTEHDTIGGVDVLLPYDALGYLKEHNEAEVVLAGKLAVVLRLNGFTLLEGRERAQKLQAHEQAQGAGGEPIAQEAGAVADAGVLHFPAEPSMADAQPSRFRAGEIDVLGQRQETPQEVAVRTSRTVGGVSASCWVLAFLSLGLATGESMGPARPYLLAAGLLLAAGGVLSFFWRRAVGGRLPQAVEHLRGQLNRIDVGQAANSAASNAMLFLGDRAKLALPLHWSPHLEKRIGEVVEVERRTADSSVLSLGKGWSIADESRRFPRVYWGRHLLQVAVAAVALLWLWLMAPDLRTEAMRAWQALQPGQLHAYESAQQMRAQMPTVGQRVRLKGQGRCEITRNPDTAEHAQPLVSDCSVVRWDGQLPQVPALSLSQVQAMLYQGRFIQGYPDPLDAIRSAYFRGSGDYLAQLVAERNMGLIVSNLSQTLAQVDEACAEGLGQCEKLRQAILDALVSHARANSDDAENGKIRSWEALGASVRKDGDAWVLKFERHELDALHRAARDAVEADLRQRIDALAPAVLQSQRTGVVLRLAQPLGPATQTWEPDPAAPAGSEEADGMSSGPGHAPYSPGPSEGDASVLDYWARLEQLSTPQAAGPIELSGLVMAQGIDAAGTPWIALDTQFSVARGWQALAWSAWWMLALPLLAIHLALLVRNGRRAVRRSKALDADMARRPLPGESSTFF